MNNIELTVIIPFYNETTNVDESLSGWIKTLRSLGIAFQIAAYNDGSKDNTLEKLIALAHSFPELHVINQSNIGHGPTILKGYREHIESPWIFQTDSDNELPPSHFHELWTKRTHFDLLLAIRQHRQSPIPRQFITCVSRLVVKIFYGKGVVDVNAPYRLIKSSFLANFIHLIPETTFAPNLIISGMASIRHIPILNHPIPHTARTSGEVSIKKFKLFKVSLKAFYEVIVFRFKILAHDRMAPDTSDNPF